MRRLLLVSALAAASILASSGAASACDCWYGYDDNYYGYSGYTYYGYYWPRVYTYSWGPPIYYGYTGPRYTGTYYYGPPVRHYRPAVRVWRRW